jgi:hypothetical protein
MTFSRSLTPRADPNMNPLAEIADFQSRQNNLLKLLAKN